MQNKSLIPEGFKDHVDFNTNVEHEFKNKIIDIFLTNGFDLVKTPLLEFYQKKNDNVFIIDSKKKEPRLFLRDDITPQIIRIASSRYKNKIRPIKLCYYGEVTRKKGSMLRPERQFLQVGSEIIGSDSILADVEIISLAYKSLKEIGIKNITLELTSKIFLEEIFSKIKNTNSLNKLKTFIKQKDIKNSLNLIEYKDDKLLLKYLFNLTGSYKDLDKKIKNIKLPDSLKLEIETIKTISKKIDFKINDQITIDFTEIDNKNYHNGIKFTFFATDVRGEVASGGRYKIKRNTTEESAVGFTCFMDTVLRASSFENSKKKILIPFDTDDNIRIKLRKEKYIIYSFLGDNSDIRLFAKNNLCTHIFENKKIKKL